jgi:Protein of unknown function (DUF3467)
MTFRGTPVRQKVAGQLTIFVREFEDTGEGREVSQPQSSCAAASFLSPANLLHCLTMSVPPQPNVKLTNAPDYRETYANSVQMRVNVWDFFLVFGTVQQQSESQVELRNFQGIYLSPQQAKALLGLLQQNVNGYETAFGEIKLDPRMSPGGQVH